LNYNKRDGNGDASVDDEGDDALSPMICVVARMVLSASFPSGPLPEVRVLRFLVAANVGS
jgi:hypothetical protein